MIIPTGASDIELYFILAAFGCIAIFFSRNRKAILIALILATVAVPVVKDMVNADRPCNGMLSCPGDPGMPSGHATYAFIFAAGSLGSPAFWFFFPAAIIVGMSRVAWGDHSMAQVAAGAGLGVALFFVSKELLVFFGGRREKVHWKIKRFVKKRALSRRRRQKQAAKAGARVGRR